VLGLCLAGSSALAATGGPDAAGYTWRDGAEPGLTYGWLDPGAGAMDVTVLGDDTTTGFLPLSFAFPYYGEAYSRLAICSNGWLSLVDDASLTFTNLSIPTVGEPRGVIAGFWNDLELTNRTSQVTLEDLGTHAIVTWDQAHDRGDTRARNTFQVVLHADGRILVQLDDLGGDTTGASLGIESPDESTGLEVFRNPAAGVTAPFVVEFAPPAIVGTDLDCTGASALACNGSVSGDRSSGLANQVLYACPTGPMDGKEQVWTLDLAVPTNLRLSLDDGGGGAQIVVLDGCDPNRCLAPPGTVVELDDFTGSAIVVIDGPAGSEGAYELFTDCFPVPGRLDCAAATSVTCGEVLSGDLREGTADQSRYWCTPDALGGREQIYRLDLAAPADVRIDLTALDGAPRMLLLKPCDPSFCSIPIGDTLQLDDATGSWFIVVDSAAGDEGSYQLTVTCLEEQFTFCGDGIFDSQAGRDPNGSWSVPGLFYDGVDTHSWAVRVDGGTIYTQDETCSPFPLTSAGTLGPDGPGLVTWDAPEVRVDVTVSQMRAATCCGLLVTADITNTDSVPHAYDLRVLHDLSFGPGDGSCTLDEVEGGPIVVDGTTYTRETELLPLGADACDRPVELYSAEDTATLLGSVEMFGPTAPSDMEFVAWANAFDPCAAWSDAQTGTNLGDCFGDSSLLLTWAFPEGGGTLAPGESGQARWRIGKGCTFNCVAPCEDPEFPGPLTTSDPDPCERDLLVEWAAAVFPDAGNGVYHVYRSPISAADALLRPPVTPVGGIVETSWIDASAPVGQPVFHAVVAESIDLAGCGEGPAASGSTATLEGAVALDESATPPILVTAAASDVAGCAPDIRLDWDAAEFPDGSGVYHLYRSTVSFAEALAGAPLTPAGGLDALTWLDTTAPPNEPLFYVLQAEGLDRPGCGAGPAVLGPTDSLEIGPVTDAVAEDPVPGTGLATDPDACTQGLELRWDSAQFPGGGAGRYHLHRSPLSFADALTRPALTVAGGIDDTVFIDGDSPLDAALYYVVQAEAVELPGCGDGPAAGGTTALLELGPVTDLGAATPLLATVTGGDEDGCSPGVALSWDAVAWPSPADGGVYHLYRSTISFADALAGDPVTPPGGLAVTTWRDAAPPANQALFYVLQAESFEQPGCGDGPAQGGLSDTRDVGPIEDAVSADVIVGAGEVLDDSACATGSMTVTWDAATFPGAGNGRYHVHRSALSLADALAQPALSPVGGLVGTAWVDATLSPGVDYWYAVIAESTDFPGCGDGPSVSGPSAVIDCGTGLDGADLVPPTLEVGPLLRLNEGTLDSVNLDWTGALQPPAGEDWVVLRSDGDASGGFVPQGRHSVTTWTDAASAAPAGDRHVWFYDVRVSDGCWISED
jgi:hypothetical protein